MNKLMQNPERSLELVVFAPIKDCLRALNSLERGGLFAHEKVIVTTYAIKHELYEFEITLKISRGKSFNTTTLRGIMHYNSTYNTTKIVASVPSKHTSFARSVSMLLYFAILIPMMIYFSHLAFLVFIFMLNFPFMVWMQSGIDKNDTAHLLTMVEQALLLADSRKSHRYGGYTAYESPFYEDEVRQKSHDDSVYSR